MITFTIPGDPKPKGRPRLGNGFRYTPPATRQAENVVRIHARAAGVRRAISGPVSLELRFYRSTRRRCDWDNLAKLVCDALNGIAWRDDDQIAHAVVVKGHDPLNPRTEVVIGSYPPPDATDWTEAVEQAEDARVALLRQGKDLDKGPP